MSTTYYDTLERLKEEIFTGIQGTNQYTDFFSECSYGELLYYLRMIYAMVAFCREKEEAECWNTIFDRVQ